MTGELPERRDPTHVLRITVPLNLDANPRSRGVVEIQEAFRRAINAILPITSLGTLGLQCDDVVVEVEEAGDPDAA